MNAKLPRTGAVLAVTLLVIVGTSGLAVGTASASEDIDVETDDKDFEVDGSDPDFEYDEDDELESHWTSIENDGDCTHAEASYCSNTVQNASGSIQFVQLSSTPVPVSETDRNRTALPLCYPVTYNSAYL